MPRALDVQLRNAMALPVIPTNVPVGVPSIRAGFFLQMDKKLPVHVLDSHSMTIVLDELDIVEDFTQYLKFKEREIDEMRFVCDCRKED